MGCMSPPARRVPRFLKARGHYSWPLSIELPEGEYQFEREFKHDFFAATALYGRMDGRQVVVKFGRCTPILFFPGRWIGRWLAERESRLYAQLSDLPQVPDYRGRLGEFGFIHVFVPGAPLKKGQRVSDQFFAELQQLIAALHGRDIAYVDLEKPENIIVGEDGRPYLIDFQISWDGHRDGLLPVSWRRWLTDRLQEMDRYHLLKHLRRNRPDLLPGYLKSLPLELPPHIRWHRRITRPLQSIRRGILHYLDPQHHHDPK
ncbi:MAG: hypothetical protein HJJLKODD_01030 [Phycisphaerae bacterium]|nr:hypothetical protein [Phycisphaerae bacterium]